MGFFNKLKNGLEKTRDSMAGKMNNVFSTFRKVDEELLDELEEILIMKKILDETPNNLDLSKKPTVILVVGVNGVGKTTSIGKIANRIKKEGKNVIVAAADTFRAAAVEQIEIWAKRSNSKIIKNTSNYLLKYWIFKYIII